MGAYRARCALQALERGQRALIWIQRDTGCVVSADPLAGRLAQLEAEIDEAGERHDLHRAERSRIECGSLVRELPGAAGLGGRDRRLGDDTERARKTVTSRMRDTIARVRPASRLGGAPRRLGHHGHPLLLHACGRGIVRAR